MYIAKRSKTLCTGNLDHISLSIIKNGTTKSVFYDLPSRMHFQPAQPHDTAPKRTALVTRPERS